MAKQMIEIEVDVPDGWEATGEFRVAKEGEFVINRYGLLHAFCQNCDSPRIILRKKYVPPSWLKPGTTIYQNYGKWYATDGEVVPCHNRMNGQTSKSGQSVELLDVLFTDFIPPPTNPYQIPEAK